MAEQFARWRPHPWHGLTPGADAPRVVNVFVEITPFDLIKYEVDKATGESFVTRSAQYVCGTNPYKAGGCDDVRCGRSTFR